MINSFVFNLISNTGVVWLAALDAVAICAILKCIEKSNEWKCEGEKEKNDKMKRVLKGLIAVGCGVLMFTSYVVSVKYSTADKEMLSSQNECTKEKLNEELKKGHELKNSDVAEFAKDCQEEEVLEKERKEKEGIVKSQMEWLRDEKRK